MEKIKKKVTHLIASSDGGDWPQNAVLFVKWFSDILSEIPDECRDSATIEFVSSANEYCSTTELIITYLRDESDDEMDRRITIERIIEYRDRCNAENLERLERQMLAKLKKKYEG